MAVYLVLISLDQSFFSTGELLILSSGLCLRLRFKFIKVAGFGCWFIVVWSVFSSVRPIQSLLWFSFGGWFELSLWILLVRILFWRPSFILVR